MTIPAKTGPREGMAPVPHEKALDEYYKLRNWSRDGIPTNQTLTELGLEAYLDGNSLGLLSQDAEASLLKLLDQWKRLGIDGWLQADPPWFYYAETLADKMTQLRIPS